MNPFRDDLLEDNAGLDLCMSIARREIEIINRPKFDGKTGVGVWDQTYNVPYADTDEMKATDAARDSERTTELRRYVMECLKRKAGNLEAIDSGECYVRVKTIHPVDSLVEAERVKEYAYSGIWRPVAEPERIPPLKLTTLAELDAMIERMTLETRAQEADLASRTF